jgi:hypothetical protein
MKLTSASLRDQVRATTCRQGLLAVWVVAAFAAGPAAGQAADNRPTDALLRLLPADTTVVLTVDGMRDQARAFAASKLAADLLKLPAVKAWFESEKYQELERSRAQIETILGTNLSEVRDELVGDGVILALKIPTDPAADASQARGLLLFQARDKALLKRLIRVLNAVQQDNGELVRLAERTRAGVTYHEREFAPGTSRPTEWYVDYPDGTFVFTNSEKMIQAVIDHKAALAASEASSAKPPFEPGLGDLAKVQKALARLPSQGVARLLLNPRLLERSAANTADKQAVEGPLPALFKRYLPAVEYVAATLEWSEAGIAVHTVETLEPEKLDPWIRRWAGDNRRFDPDLARAPTGALAVACGRVDGSSLWDAIALVAGPDNQPKLANIEAALSGLLLGQDLRTAILPNLGPGVVAYIDPPSDADTAPRADAGGRAPWPLAIVIAFSVNEPHPSAPPVSVFDAVDNALRTVLAFSTLDEKRSLARARITTRTVAGVDVRAFDIPVPFAYAVDRVRKRVVVGTSAAAVTRFIECAADPKAGKNLRNRQKAALAGADTFLCVDFNALDRLAAAHRDRLVQTLAARHNRSVAEVEADLAHVLALARLFEAAIVTCRTEPDATAVYRSARLIAH